MSSQSTPSNYVTGPYQAVIDGKPTGFSGCDGGPERCDRPCIRKDEKLDKGRIIISSKNCSLFIPYS